MYKEFTDEIWGYDLVKTEKLAEVQQILKDYLIEYEVWEEGRDMTKEGSYLNKGSAFCDVFVRNGLLDEWYKPTYAKISMSKEFMLENGFKTVSDDGVYGEAVDIRSGMTTINWNRKGHTVTYFGEILKPNIAVMIQKDNKSRTAFNGYIFSQFDLRKLLEQTW